jgi:hypothetical protein
MGQQITNLVMGQQITKTAGGSDLCVLHERSQHLLHLLP